MAPRRLLFILTMLVWLLPPLAAAYAPQLAGAAWARGGSDSGSDDSGSDDGGSDDGGSDEGGSDEGGSDESGSDEGGSDEGGSGSGSGSGSGTDDGGDDDTDSSGSGSGSGSSSGGGGFGGNGVHVYFADGSRAITRNGIYEQIDARGRVIEHRAATRADRNRLLALRDGITSGRGNAVTAVVVDEAQNMVQLIDAKGWVEVLKGKTYSLTDPNGNTVTRRKATARDLKRMRAYLGL